MASEKEHMPTEERLKELLVGKSIINVRMDVGYALVGYVTLSDDTVLKVWGNDGGCGCSAGCYSLTLLNGTENVITNVQIEASPAGDYYDDGEREGSYRIFVWANEERVNFASFEGSDGNGYYGTGWWLQVIDNG